MTAYETLIDALRAAGRHIIETGQNKSSAQCPAHDDHNPSLSIWPRDDGKGVQLKCHAGCNYADVLAAIGLAPRDLYDDAGMRNALNPNRDYRYPRFTKSRYIGAKGEKSFAYKPKGVKDNSLYLADKIPADCPMVFCTEGEKGAEAIWAMGAVAVSTGGAERTHCDFSPLRGRDVVLIVDRDTSGLKWAAKLRQPVTSIAATIRFVRCALNIPKADVVEHIDAGLTLTQLEDFDPATTSYQDEPPAGNETHQAGESVPAFTVKTLSDVTPEQVKWLWPGRLPLGKVITLDGDPGKGKSTLALTFGAIITTAGQWPDGGQCDYPGDVILMSAEDGLADTVRPRLDAAGGDPTRVHAVQGVPLPLDDGDPEALRMATLADIALLRRLIKHTHARLVIIDVLMAYLPTGTDSYRDQDVRQVLGRLAALAEATECAILLLRHLNKGKGDPLYRGGGSIGIVGASRVGLLAAPDPDDDELHVLASVKNNLAPIPTSLTYRLVSHGPFDVACIEWVGESDHDARALLTEHDTQSDTTTGTEARYWLEDYLLEQGRILSRQAKDDGHKAGYSQASIERAASKLKVISEAEGFPRITYWKLPPPAAPKPPQSPQSPQSPRTSEYEATDVTDVTEAAFEAPTGPDRCPECGHHTPTQGHKPDCPANNDEPLF